MRGMSQYESVKQKTGFLAGKQFALLQTGLGLPTPTAKNTQQVGFII